MSAPKPNITDVALIFEGGGMRCSYTAGVVATLLENDLNFGAVYGISAGASHGANYLSRDVRRAKSCFVDLVKDPEFGGYRSMAEGKGFFNGVYLYEGVAERVTDPDNLLYYDFDTFADNEATFSIEAFDWDTGETKLFTKEDMGSAYDLMLEVRASSTMPFFMPPVTIDGHTYVDGGLGSSWGIPLLQAVKDGYSRFFIVRSQPRDYRKKPMKPAAAAIFKMLFARHPLVGENTVNRWAFYNGMVETINQLEDEGYAYVFYPEEMKVTNKTTDYDLLAHSLASGIAQANKELPLWEKWLQS